MNEQARMSLSNLQLGTLAVTEILRSNRFVELKRAGAEEYYYGVYEKDFEQVLEFVGFNYEALRLDELPSFNYKAGFLCYKKNPMLKIRVVFR